jgi:elongation factor Ts
MAITAKDVQTLREMTGVGMMDCKKALVASDVILTRRSSICGEGPGRRPEEGGPHRRRGVSRMPPWWTVVGVAVEGQLRDRLREQNEMFPGLCQGVAAVVAKENPPTWTSSWRSPSGHRTYRPGGTAGKGSSDQTRTSRCAVFARYDGGLTVPYIHMGGKIGVLVNLEVSDNLKDSEKVLELGKDEAMQIAAMRPLYL